MRTTSQSIICYFGNIKDKNGVSNIPSWMASLVSQPSQCLCGTVITGADAIFQPIVLYGNDLGTWGQKQKLWLVNSPMYMSQRHRNHQELCRGNSIRPVIISCLKKLQHYIKREIPPPSISLYLTVYSFCTCPLTINNCFFLKVIFGNFFVKVDFQIIGNHLIQFLYPGSIIYCCWSFRYKVHSCPAVVAEEMSNREWREALPSG